MIPDPNSRLFARLRKPELRLGLGCGVPAGGPGDGPAVAFNFLSGDALDWTRAPPRAVAPVAAPVPVAVATFPFTLDDRMVTLPPES